MAHFSQTTLYREICLEKVAKYFPKYTPRDDFELLALACWFGKPHNASDAQIAAYLKEEWRVLETESGVERAHQIVQMRLEEKVQITGVSVPGLRSVRHRSPTCGVAQAYGEDTARLHATVAGMQVLSPPVPRELSPSRVDDGLCAHRNGRAGQLPFRV